MTFGGENDQIDLTGVEVPEDVTPEPDTEQDAIPEAEAEDTTPEPEPTPAPAVNPGDFMARMERMAALQEQQMLAQQQAAEQQRRQQEEAARPKPLMEQDEWRTRYEDAAERMTYDPEARRTFMTMNNELAREQVRAELAPIQQQFQLEARGDTVLREAGQAVRQQYGDMVSDEAFGRLALQIFGNRAEVARALDASNPQSAMTRDMLAKLAIGDAVAAGKYKPGTTPKPPPNPRSPARSSTPAAPAPVKEAWGDDDFIAGVISDALTGRKP